jgi:hypothetical protein
MLLAGISGCGDYTDAATRLAYEIEREAKALQQSGEATRVFTHRPKSAPEGVDDAYTVKFALGYAGKGGLTVSGFNIAQKKQVGYGTSYHLRFVQVPKDLTVSKPAGEPVVVVLTRVGDAVHVTELR